jgi:acyl carrier protein
MQNAALLNTIRSTIIEVLDLDDDAAIGETTTAEDVDGWDSLQHVRILTTLERRFSFRFADHEVQGLTNVGDLLSVISQKVASKA